MSRKHLSRIADSLEQIAAQQAEMLKLMKATAEVGNQNLAAHASMFSNMKEMLEPLMTSLVTRLESKQVREPEPHEPLPPQPTVIERNGMRVIAAAPRTVEVNTQ